MRDLIIFSNSNSRVVLTEIRVLKFKKYTFQKISHFQD